MNNAGKILKVVLLLVLLMMFFHPILSIIFLVKFGGILFAIGAICAVIKILIGKSIFDLLRGDQRQIDE